jgi:hypothetical protein
MTTLNRVLTTIFDVLTWPLSWMPPLAGLVILSVLTGILFLLVFPHVSNQGAIKRTKDAIKARLLEIRLFKDDLMLVLRATGRILVSNGLYLWHNLRAMVILLVPFCLILFQLNARYAYGPLKVGDRTLLTARFKPGTPLQDVRLDLPARPGGRDARLPQSRPRTRSTGDCEPSNPATTPSRSGRGRTRSRSTWPSTVSLRAWRRFARPACSKACSTAPSPSSRPGRRSRR